MGAWPKASWACWGSECVALLLSQGIFYSYFEMSNYKSGLLSVISLLWMIDFFIRSLRRSTDGFDKALPCRRMLKTAGPPRAVDWPRSTISLSSAQKSHLMSPWMLRGPNTAERRRSLYCAAISHISLCSLAASKRLRPPYSVVPCERRPAALWSGETAKALHCHS